MLLEVLPLDELLDEELEDEELEDEEELLEVLELLDDELELDDEELDEELDEAVAPSATQLKIAAVESLPSPCIPKLVEPPTARLPFHSTFVAV